MQHEVVIIKSFNFCLFSLLATTIFFFTEEYEEENEE